MQRWIPILGLVLALQLAAAVALDLHGNRLAPSRPNTPLVAGDLKAVDRVTIDGPVSRDQAADKTQPDTRVELVERDGHWLLPGDFDAPGDATKVDGLLQRLSAAKRGLPVATTSAALDRFKVGERDYERRLVMSHGNQALATVYLGSAAGPRKATARTARDKAVYTVELATYDLPTRASDWLDKSLLKRDAATLTEIDVATGDKPPLTLRRATGSKTDGAPPAWQAVGLAADRQVDEAKATALAQTIANLQVDAVLGTEAQPDWVREPELNLTLKNAQGKTVTWTLSKRKTGDTHVLKVSDRPWYLELKSWDAQPLLSAANDGQLIVASSKTTPAAKHAAASGGGTRGTN